MNARDEQDALIEAALGAFRERDPLSGRIKPVAAFFDLAPAALDELFARQTASRHLERAAHPAGLSTTARAVIERAFRLRQLPRG
jgi:hypothetical protein